MIIHPVAQGGEAWHRIRSGVVTASMVDVVRAKVNGLDERQAAYVKAIQAGADEKQAMAMAGYKNRPQAVGIERALAGMPVGEWSDAAKNYAFKLAIERITGAPLGDDEFNPWQAQRGSKLEEEARMEHEIHADVTVQVAGFVTTDDGRFGASADGLIGDDEGAEYKCFLTTSKLRPILLDADTSMVFGQCQMNMALTDRVRWHFGLYLPDLRPIRRHFTLIVIERDDEWIKGMWADLEDFDRLVEDYRARLLRGEVPEVRAMGEPDELPADMRDPHYPTMDSEPPPPAAPKAVLRPDAIPAAADLF